MNPQKYPIIGVIAAFFAVVIVASCSMFTMPETDDGDGAKATGVSFKSSRLSVAVAGSEYLQLVISPADLQRNKIAQWQYDSSKITVEPDTYGAVITGVSEGETVVKASVDGISATAIISVQGFAAEYTQPPYIYSNYSVIELMPGSIETVSVSLYGGQSWQLENFVWSIADPSIARISTSRNNCVVEALKTGSTQVTASHPDCEYGFTVTIFVYSDVLTESYLSTNENIISINTADSNPKTLTVSVKNPSGVVNPTGFIWTLVDEIGNPVVNSPIASLTANGATVLVSPLASGLQKARVTYQDCTYPLDILIRVTTTVANVYIEPSVSTLMVTGSDNIFSVYANITGFSGYADTDAFIWTVPEDADALMDWTAAGNTFSIQGKKNGVVKVKVSHPLSETARTILIILQEQVGSAADAQIYITTSSNYIQTQVGATPTEIAVSLIGGEDGDESAFVWAIEGGINNDIIRIDTPTGYVTARAIGSLAFGKLIVTPLKMGTVAVIVSHPRSPYSTTILIRVYSAVAQLIPETYITTDTNIVRLLNGSRQEISVTLAGNIAAGDENGITWKSENPAIATVSPSSGGTVVVSAVGNGVKQTYITASHTKAQAEKRILIITADIQQQLDETKIIYADKTYVRINAGISETLYLNQIGLSSTDIMGITWTVNKPEIAIVNITGGNRLNAVVTGVSTGMAKVTAALSSGQTCIFDITVLATGETPQTVMVTTIISDINIVRLLNGSSQEISVILAGNITVGDENGIAWNSQNPTVATVSPSSGGTVIVSAVGSGVKQTYITASHTKAQAEKRILVITADTQQQLDETKIIYADKTYVRINAGASETLHLNQIGLSSTDIIGITWTVNRPETAIVNITGGNRLSAVVAGVSAGTAKVTAALSSGQTCIFDITVLATGETPQVITPQYLTTAKNAVILTQIGDTASVSVSGVNIPSISLVTQTLWSIADSNIASVAANGASASIIAKNVGSTKITVSNPDSANALTINIKVGAVYEWTDVPPIYITTQNDVIAMVKGTQKTIGVSLVNSTAQGGFSFSVTGKPIITAAGSSSGSCLIEALDAGVSEITISHPLAAANRQIIAVIANSEDELRGIAYLSTKQNVVTIGEGSNMTVSITMENTPQPVLSGYSWISDNPLCIEVVSSGQTAVFYGRKTGTAKITVANAACPYPLQIIANCVNPTLAAQSPYITTANIITLTVGATASSIAAELIGGTDADKAAFTWFASDPTIVQLYANGETAQVKALKEGVTQITVRHPKAGGVDRTILVICETVQASPCYITASESIIRMSPADSAMTITASLINGAADDAYNFKWWADDYTLIDLNYSGGQAVIKPLGAGTVMLHVSHPKAAYQKDIVLYISQYQEFAFEKTQVQLTVGTQAFVNLQIPAMQVKTKVSYTVKKADGSGGDASNVLSAGGTNAVCVLDPHEMGSAVVQASLIAVNSGAVQASAELLVSVKNAPINPTYINYNGGTVITLEKGVVKTLSASLAGANAQSGDSDSLQWTVSAPDGSSPLTLSPQSVSGTAVGREVRIQAVDAGKEAVVTIHHEKADTDVNIYIIIPGQTSAKISLNQTALLFEEGGQPVTLAASIINAALDDYENLAWTLVNSDPSKPAAEISGNGRQISIRPLYEGTAVITASVGSSGATADCSITVEPKKSLLFIATQLQTYPSNETVISYTITPANEADNVDVTVGDKAIIQKIAHDKQNRTITIKAEYREGSTYLEAYTPSGLRTRLPVDNSWGNTFTLNKTALVSPPTADADTFTIRYSIRPACAELRIVTDAKLPLTAGTYDELINGTYIIRDKNASTDSLTGVKTGTIHFKPTGETATPVSITAHNPRNTLTPEGAFIGKDFAIRTVQTAVGYSSYHFIMSVISKTGVYSRWASDAFILGDGEGVSFRFVPQANMANPTINSVTFSKNPSSDGAQDGNGKKQYQYLNSNANFTDSSNGFTMTGNSGVYEIYHTLDYGKNSGNTQNAPKAHYFGTNADQAVIEDTNTTVRAVPLVGTIEIKYTTGTGVGGTFKIPIYVEVRNCPKNYTP
jgi:hypothetical protein